MKALGPGTLRKETRGRGQWVLDYVDKHGRRQRRALSTDRRVAERRRMEIVRERDGHLAGGGDRDALLVDLVEPYLADLAVRSSAHHVRNVRSTVTRALASLGPSRVGDLLPIDLVKFRTAQVAAGLSHRTANLAVERVVAMVAWAAAMGLVSGHVVPKVKRLPEGAKHLARRRRAMTEAEIEAFLAAAALDDERCVAMFPTPRVPQLPLWRAFLETGARYGELTRVVWGDVDLEARVLSLRAEETKSGRARAIPLGGTLVDAIAGLRFVHHRVLGHPVEGRDRVFLTPEGAPWPWHTANLRRIFERTLAAAGIERANASGERLDVHALRHTLATRLARNGVPMAQAQRLLGHSDPKLTARVYTHLEVEDLRGAVASLERPGSNRSGSNRREVGE